MASTSDAFRPKIELVIETPNDIIVHLIKSSYEEFGLYMSGFLISQAQGSGYVVSFSLSPKLRAKILHHCVYIKNYKNKLIKFRRKSKHGFKVSIGNKYVENTKYLANNEEEIKKSLVEILAQVQKYNNYKNSLSNNISYKNQSCYRPTKKIYPLKPSTIKCESEEECRNDAEQLCILKVGGAVGCSELAQNEGYSSAQVSALCGLAFAEMLQQKYSLNDAIVDTFVGFIDDVADSSLESDSTLWKLFGVVAKGTAVLTKFQQLNACKSNYIRRFYSPYENWQAEIRNINREPKEKYQKCESDKSSLDSLVDSIYKKKKYLEELIVINSSVKKKLDEVQIIEITPTCD